MENCRKCCRGLLRARSRFPEAVENIEKGKQRNEATKRVNVLAKQVLSRNGLHRLNDCLAKWIAASNFPGPDGITSGYARHPATIGGNLQSIHGTK